MSTEPTVTPAPDAVPPAAEPSILDSAKAPAEPGSSEPTAKPEDGSSKPPTDGTPKGDEPAKSAEPKPGAPEKYEAYKVPEGVTLDPKAVESFNALAKELNLSQEHAQKLVDFQTSAIQAAKDQLDQNFKEQQKQWADETRKALGADADKELAFAALARDKFAPENSELRIILQKTGLDSNPAIVKHFITIGKAISEDAFVPGKPALPKTPKSDGELFYPDMKK